MAGTKYVRDLLGTMRDERNELDNDVAGQLLRRVIYARSSYCPHARKWLPSCVPLPAQASVEFEFRFFFRGVR